MDADGLPIIGPSVDYRKVDPIDQKRTVSFLNHFIMHTTGFLNRFSNVCEEKLSHLSVRIQRLETQMTLLEGKLTSIPGLDQMKAPTTTTTTTTATSGNATQGNNTQQPQNTNTQQTTATQQQSSNPSTPQTEDKKDTDNPSESATVTVSQDPRYARFFKMLSVGIPEMAVRQKMALEGLNPDMISNPNAPVPAGGATQDTNRSDSDFSDDDVKSESSDGSSIEFSD